MDEEGYSSWEASGVDKKTLTSVAIPSSVTTLGSNSFWRCGVLVNVAIPPSVTSIEGVAFAEYFSLKSVAIPPSVTRIGRGAFFDCISSASVAVPTSMTIEACAFYECSSLTSIDIPTAVTIIEACAFQNCRSFRSVAIPKSVTRIEGGAFAGCSSLTSVEIPASVTTLGGALCQDGPFIGAFEACTSLAVLMVQPIDTNDNDDAASTAGPQLPARLPSSKHSTSKPQLTAVTKIWATADVIKGLKGQFAAYTQFKDVPRANQAAPDVKTWAGVQRWLWRLLPTSFSSDVDRVVCKPRQLTDSGDDAGRAPCRRDGHLAALAGIALAAHVWVLEARPPTDARSLALHSCEVFWQPRTYG